MNKEIEESRAHKLECQRLDKEINEYIKALAEDLQKRGYMFALVVGDKYGRCIQTTAYGPTNMFPRLISAAGDSMSRLLSDKVLKLEKLCKEGGIDFDA